MVVGVLVPSQVCWLFVLGYIILLLFFCLLFHQLSGQLFHLLSCLFFRLHLLSHSLLSETLAKDALKQATPRKRSLTLEGLEPRYRGLESLA